MMMVMMMGMDKTFMGILPPLTLSRPRPALLQQTSMEMMMVVKMVVMAMLMMMDKMLMMPPPPYTRQATP